MAGKRLNPRRAKVNRFYSVEEVARLYGIHRQTVRNWIKAGLVALTNGRPHLIAGSDLRAFLERRRASGKASCRPGELYCLRCRKPRPAAEGMLDYIPITRLSGNLRALCPVCSCLMHRRVSLQNIEAVRGAFTVTFPHGHERLADCRSPPLNCQSATSEDDVHDQS